MVEVSGHNDLNLASITEVLKARFVWFENKGRGHILDLFLDPVEMFLDHLANINEVSGCSRNRGSSINALKSAAYASGIDATASSIPCGK
jgi:hypothetical protein